jgi:predicted site-specific integrase-resolvase
MGRLLALKEGEPVLRLTRLTIQRWDKVGKIRVVRTASGRRRIPKGREVKLTARAKGLGELMAYGRVFPPEPRWATWRDESG